MTSRERLNSKRKRELLNLSESNADCTTLSDKMQNTLCFLENN